MQDKHWFPEQSKHGVIQATNLLKIYIYLCMYYSQDNI